MTSEVSTASNRDGGSDAGSLTFRRRGSRYASSPLLVMAIVTAILGVVVSLPVALALAQNAQVNREVDPATMRAGVIALVVWAIGALFLFVHMTSGRGLQRALQLDVAATGVTFHVGPMALAATWAQIGEIDTVPWSLGRTDALLLTDPVRPLGASADKPPVSQGILLPLFERGWRTGELGAAIEQFAPHLLAVTDGRDPALPGGTKASRRSRSGFASDRREPRGWSGIRHLLRGSVVPFAIMSAIFAFAFRSNDTVFDAVRWFTFGFVLGVGPLIVAEFLPRGRRVAAARVRASGTMAFLCWMLWSLLGR